MAIAWLPSAVSTADAAPITVSMTNGTRAASATFDVSGTNLVVTLTNTSTFDSLVPVDLLTGVFFNLAGSPVLSHGAGSSAVLGTGSSVLYPDSGSGTDAGSVVGGEWALGQEFDANGLFQYAGFSNATYGLSSTGIGLFGPGDVFPGTNLSGPASPNGPQYGIVSAGDNPATANGGLSTPIIKNAVVFTIPGLPPGFNPFSSVSGVTFLYGTALCVDGGVNTCFGGSTTTVVIDAIATPEPASLVLLGSGIAWIVLRRRRR